MNILILGGNEGSHMIAKLLLDCPRVDKVYHHGAYLKATPTSRYIPLNFDYEKSVAEQKDQLLSFIDIPGIDLIILNAIQYIIWPRLQEKIKNKNIPLLGPSKDIGMLEWSKVLGKELLTKLNIPTPKYKVYSLNELLDNFLKIERPFVFKFDKDDRLGLQTVIVTDENYLTEYDTLKEQGAGRLSAVQNETVGPIVNPTFVVEEFLDVTREYSYHVISNSVSWQYLGSARDYKRRYENDQGFNTVGIGAYANVEINPIVHTYTEKILNYLKENDKEWIGFVYLGIMEDKNGIPHVLEINARLGNPELQVILPLIKNDIKNLFYTTATNQTIEPIEFKNKSAVAVRIINKDYHLAEDPKNVISPDFDNPDDSIMVNYPIWRRVFNASIVAVDDSIDKASDRIYTYLEGKEMYNYTYRKDVGYLK